LKELETSAQAGARLQLLLEAFQSKRHLFLFLYTNHPKSVRK